MRREDWAGDLPVVSVFTLLQQVHPSVIAVTLPEYSLEYRRQRSAFTKLLGSFMRRPVLLILKYIGGMGDRTDNRTENMEIIRNLRQRTREHYTIPPQLNSTAPNDSMKFFLMGVLGTVLLRQMRVGAPSFVTFFGHRYFPDIVWLVYNWVANVHGRLEPVCTDFDEDFYDGVKLMAQREWACALLENVCYDQRAIFRWYFFSTLWGGRQMWHL